MVLVVEFAADERIDGDTRQGRHRTVLQTPAVEGGPRRRLTSAVIYPRRFCVDPSVARPVSYRLSRGWLVVVRWLNSGWWVV